MCLLYVIVSQAELPPVVPVVVVKLDCCFFPSSLVQLIKTAVANKKKEPRDKKTYFLFIVF